MVVGEVGEGIGKVGLFGVFVQREVEVDAMESMGRCFCGGGTC